MVMSYERWCRRCNGTGEHELLMPPATVHGLPYWTLVLCQVCQGSGKEKCRGKAASA